MEGFDMRRNKIIIKTGNPLNSKHENRNSEFSDSVCKNGGFIEHSSQVQMITDSLLACLKMSKCRPPKRISDALGKTKTRLPPETFNQSENEIPQTGENTIYVNHMLKQENCYRKFQEWNSVISQEVVMDSDVKKCSFKDLSGVVSQNTLKTLEDKADSISMVDIIEGELRTLTSLVPTASKTASNLSKWVSHYKECTRCQEKISLLEILHRIQELNLYVARKHKKTQNRSTQSKERDDKSVQEIVQQVSIKSVSFKEINKEEPKDRQVEKSLTLDPAAIAEGNPGVQILLEVDPDKKKLYHFSTAKVNDISYPSAVQATKSSKDKSNILSSPKLYSFITYFAPTFFARSPDSVLILNNPIDTYKSVKRTLEKTRRISYLNRVHLSENQTLQWTDNFSLVFFKKIGCLNVPETLQRRNNSSHSDDSSDFLPNPLKKLQERMEFRSVDEEVAALRNMITEVQQSQIRLSKVLLNEGIFSQPLIRLTNPNLLEEESKTLKRISEFGNASFETTSLDHVQDAINNLKEKCSFKNRLITTVTKGLRHNVPKEWWEEIVGYTFEGSNALSDRDYEKVDGLLRQCSFYFARQEKELEQAQERRVEERPSEEESNMKDYARASTQDSWKILSRCEDRVASTRGSWMCPDADTFVANQPIISQQLLDQQSTSEQTPRENQTNVRDRWMKSLENQISMLSVENTKLWEEIHALRDSVENSAKDVSIKKAISVSNGQSVQDMYAAPGKTINVTVQISSDKIARRSKDHEVMKIHRYSDTAEDGHSRTSKLSLKPDTSRRSEQKEQSSSRKPSLTDTKAKLQIKSERRRSKNDLNCLDDFGLPSSESRQDNKEYLVISKDKLINRESNPIVQQVTLTEHPEIYNFLKESQSRESQKSQKAGPSHKNLEIDYLLQRPSLVKLGGSQTAAIQVTKSNERELQPIMENDHPEFASSFCSSSSLCQAVQQLRARVRSIHKEVTVLKSKNDRIDKLLDKLLDDAVDNNKSFEEIENNLKNFTRLD